jgi:hypothetical protein
MAMRVRCQRPVRGRPEGEDPVLELISKCLTFLPNFSEDARCRFATLLPEPEVDNPEKHPSFCLTADHLARTAVWILFPCVTPSLSGALFKLAIKEWANPETQRISSITSLPTIPQYVFPYIHSNRGAQSPDDEDPSTLRS